MGGLIFKMVEIIGFIIFGFIISFIILWIINFYKKHFVRYVDFRGYERNGLNRLIHRDLAYKYHYISGFRDGLYTQRFREYDVHHIDKDKRNNHPDNLQILTREEHKKIHEN